MQEGKTIVCISGVITQLRAVHGEDSRRRRRLWGQRNAEPSPAPAGDFLQVSVDGGTDDLEAIAVELPCDAARDLRVGQRVTIEVKMGATP